MEHEQHILEEPKRPERRRVSVWKVIGITVAVLAVVVGLGFVGYIALVALAFSSYGSNK
jgi:Na+(H+)/acetate symporter ActP